MKTLLEMNIPAPIKRIVTIACWIGLGGGVLGLLIAAINAKNSARCKGMEVRINGNVRGMVVDRQEITRLLATEGVNDIRQQMVAGLDLHKLESALRRNPWVREANIFVDNNEMLQVRVSEKQPVARVFNLSGKSWLLDSTGSLLPLTGKTPMRLPVFTGYPGETFGRHGHDSALNAQIRNLSRFLNQDSFWCRAIEQVNITPARTFELTPLIGNQVIEFGDGNDIEGKFRRLMLFYRQVMAKTGFAKYERIKVEFAGQVIGTKRGGYVSRADSLQAIRNVMDMIRAVHRLEADSASAPRQVKPLETAPTEQSLQGLDIPEEKMTDDR